ncbi:hypothetical protein IW140_003932 [Coemansia sp. RSA 1813]|nr:hypothetical protein IW140_003932 [Coemansia sp. RSA 1813]
MTLHQNLDMQFEIQALDIRDAAFTIPGTRCKGSDKDTGQSDVIIVTAGAYQQSGEPRFNGAEQAFDVRLGGEETMKLDNATSTIKETCRNYQ